MFPLSYLEDNLIYHENMSSKTSLFYAEGNDDTPT